MKSICAFIDESGNHDLDTKKGGASKYFILVAIIIESDSLQTVYPQAEEIRRLHFQKGEIKSNGVTNKDGHKRRIKILDDLMALDFKFYALAVDKASLMKDSGLQYKESFIKFINGKLYRRLFRTYTDVAVVADEHGSQSFKDSFRQYIIDNHKPDLFYKSEFSQVQSQNNVMVQVADFIVGTIAKVYEGKNSPALYEHYLKLVASKALHIDEWPTKVQTYFPSDDFDAVFDPFIFSHSLAKAEAYVKDCEKSDDEDVQMQLCILQKLIFECRWGSGKSYLSAPVLIEHMSVCGFGKVSEQHFRTGLIAALRDADVVIASCNKGYKIPTCFSDLHDFVERVDSLVVPYLSRLKMARDSYKHASNGDVDLLAGVDYPVLVRLLDQMDR